MFSHIDKLLSKYSCIGFDGKKCAKLKWNIGIITGVKYEGGLPHTRKDIIIIPVDILNSNLYKTLIHEKIHVYQKKYIDDISLYLNENGYTKYKEKKHFDNIRSNPDLDDYIYKNKNGQIMITIYKNTSPNSIQDTLTMPINNSTYEHPLEFMAYNLTNKI